LSEGVDLDGEVRRVDPDRWLCSRFVADPAARARLVALYAFDHELVRASAVTSNALTAEIRLVWWREAVDEIFAGRTPRRHPTVEALADAALAARLPPQPFESMIEARIAALESPAADEAGALAFARATEGSLARLAAEALGAGDQAALAEPAGVVWGLRLLGRCEELRATLAEARASARRLPPTAFPAVLCATLARAPRASDLEKRARLTWAALTGGI
jgi:15-cis-phytoene synthase